VSQILLHQVRVELTREQIIAAVRQLSPRDREHIRRVLDSEQWRREFEQLLERIQVRVKKHPISDDEILEEVRLVRAERHARRLAKSSR